MAIPFVETQAGVTDEARLGVFSDRIGLYTKQIDARIAGVTVGS
jgi:hypothetical protein